MSWRMGHGAITRVEVNWVEPLARQIRGAMDLGETIWMASTAMKSRGANLGETESPYQGKAKV